MLMMTAQYLTVKEALVASPASHVPPSQDLRASSRGKIPTFAQLVSDAARQHEAYAAQEDDVSVVQDEEDDEQLQTPTTRGLQLPTDMLNPTAAKTADKRQTAKGSEERRRKLSQPQ